MDGSNASIRYLYPIFYMPRFSWSHVCLYHGASEVDLLTFAGNVSLQLCKLGSDIECLVNQGAKASTALLFLLGSGGVIAYFLSKRKRNYDNDDDNDSNDDNHRRQKQKPKKPRWGRVDSWFKWLFEDECFEFSEEDLRESNDAFFVQGQYFGPNNSRNKLSLDLHPHPSSSSSSNNRVHIAPCPNCIRGSCRIRKHQFTPCSTSSTSSYSSSPLHNNPLQLPPTSTPDSADDENSDDGESEHWSPCHRRKHKAHHEQRREGDGMSDPSEQQQQTQPYYPRVKLFNAAKSRRPKGGRERWSLSPIGYRRSLTPSVDRFEREESVDSIISVTGSMAELVKGAREVRRLIRDASFDSLCSDYSVFSDLNNEVPFRMTTSQSDYVLSEVAPPPPSEAGEDRGCDEDIYDDERRKELLNSKSIWRMTAINNSDFESSPTNHASYGWESPKSNHHHHIWTDLRHSKYKTALRYGEDEDDEDRWEWDSEGLNFKEEDDTIPVNHDAWLQSDNYELDLEYELRNAIYNQHGGSCSTSNRSSCERESSFLRRRRSGSIGQRLPPSGRSSVDPLESPKVMKNSWSSDESGFQDEGVADCCCSTSTSTLAFTSSVLTLSPVHEAKEPTTMTTMTTLPSPLSSPAKGVANKAVQTIRSNINIEN